VLPHLARSIPAWGLIACRFLFFSTPASALGKTTLDLELDPYYTPLSLTVPFVAGADENDVEASELKTYRDMLSRALVPRFLVLEASVNPLPLAGALIRRHGEHFYDEAQTSPSANLVEALTAGFEEPWAVTAFLGKVIDYSEGRKVTGHRLRGYTGYVVSYGNYHLLSNRLIPDHWIEAEAKVKGDQKTDLRRMRWSLRFGTKRHGNREILDTCYFGIRRDRTDYQKTPWSWLFSSAFEYRLDFDPTNCHSISHFLMGEKNWPLLKGKAILSVGVGYLWKSNAKYSGSLAQYRRPSEGQFLFRPNMKF
jgi:hypothetical protein